MDGAGHSSPRLSTTPSTRGPRPRRSGRLRPLLRAAALMAASIAATLLVLEAGVRLVAPQDPDFFDSAAFLRMDPRPGEPLTLVPGARGNYTGVPVRINSLGLRDGEISPAPPEGVTRILVVGDSVTFGFGVRLEETYVKRLPSLMAARDPDLRVETVNAGVPAAGLTSYERAIRRFVPGIRPRLVVVGLVLNDILDYDTVVDPSRGGAAPAEGAVAALNQALLRHSHLYLLGYMRGKSLLYRLGLLDINRTYRDHFLALEPRSPGQDRAWESTLKHLGAIVDAAREASVPLAFAIFPLEPQLDAGRLELYRSRLGLRAGNEALQGLPQRRLAAAAAALGIPTLDLLPAFRGSGKTDLYLRNQSITFDWIHLSPEGHAVAAEAIAEWLEGEAGMLRTQR